MTDGFNILGIQSSLSGEGSAISPLALKLPNSLALGNLSCLLHGDHPKGRNIIAIL